MFKFYIAEGSGCFSRHARADGHPGCRSQFFWIPAFAGMTDLSAENTPTPDIAKLFECDGRRTIGAT